MKDEQMDDLKQFIDSKISQSEQVLRDEISGVDNKIEELRHEVQDGFAGVGEAIEEIHKILDTKVTKPELS